MPFHVAIADGGLEIEAKISNEAEADKLIQILQTIKPLLQNIYGREPSPLAGPRDPPDFGEHTHRVFGASMTPHEGETGMSGLVRRGGVPAEEQIREMKPEVAHRALGLIS